MSTTSSNDPVQQVLDLLGNAGDAEWPSDTPPTAIRGYQDDSQGNKGPSAGQPPILYVLAPTDTTLERFSADGDLFDQSHSVFVQVWSYDPDASKNYQLKVASILSDYLDDNAVETPNSTVEPTAMSDFRHQTHSQDTDYHILSVEAELRGLQGVDFA